jgi:hypothetical protein
MESRGARLATLNSPLSSRSRLTWTWRTLDTQKKHVVLLDSRRLQQFRVSSVSLAHKDADSSRYTPRELPLDL